jgi:aryl-alcohol dehydrogenase-like predicted oxidoreductase
MDGVKASLKRLQLDHIDLYQIHGFDPVTPIEETVRALDNLVQQGPCALCGRVELGGLADREGAGHCRAPGPRALRIAAGLLHRRRAATWSANWRRCCRAKTSA